MKHKDSTSTQKNEYAYHQNSRNKFLSLIFSFYISLCLNEHIHIMKAA
jgi:hypothetical protein